MGAVTITLAMDGPAAFDVFVEELTSALAVRGIHFNAGPDGSLAEGGREIGRVKSWDPGKNIQLEWKAPDWKTEAKSGSVQVRFQPDTDGTRVIIEHLGWDRLFEDQGEAVGWFASEVAAPFLQAMAPSRFGDWITDRSARCPSGAKARNTYRDPVYHRPNFLAILNTLRLQRSDYLLEVGCGGGAFLKNALLSGCRAAAVDHSYEMVRLALDVNAEAVAAGRLIIHEAEAEQLPFADEVFTCAVMTGVFGFLPKPATTLAEICRVLAKEGRLVVFTSTKELRGTPAAPEPIASRLTFYEDDELKQLALQVGFASVHVERPNLKEYAQQSGVPKEALPLFSGREGQLLIATK